MGKVPESQKMLLMPSTSSPPPRSQLLPDGTRWRRTTSATTTTATTRRHSSSANLLNRFSLVFLWSFTQLSMFFFQCSTADENLTTVLVCEGGLASLHCPPQHEIAVHLANFGRFSLQTCNPTMRLDINTQCHNPRTIDVLRASCDHLQRCNVLASNEVFGDECPGNAKYLEASYECFPAKATTTTTTTTLSTSAASAANSATTTVAMPAAQGNLLPFDGGGGGEVPEAAEDDRGNGKHGKEGHQTPLSCAPRMARSLRWPRTELGRPVRVPCPQGSRGLAEWLCSPEGQWTPELGPNFGRCLADWARELREDLEELGSQETSGEQRQTWLEVLREAHGQVRKEQLSGADIRLLGEVLAEVAVKLRQGNKGQPEQQLHIMLGEQPDEKTKARQQELLEFVRLIIDTLGHLLRANQRLAWFDLSAGQRQSLAVQLLQVMPQTLALLLPLPNWPKAGSESLLAEPTLVAEVAQASIYDYVPFPSMSLYRQNFDTALMPREALQLYGQNLANVFYTAWDPSLGNHLLGDDNDNSKKTRRKIVSKLVGLSLVPLDGKQMLPGQLRPLERPLVLTFQNIEFLAGGSRYTEPRCVWWDPEKSIFVEEGKEQSPQESSEIAKREQQGLPNGCELRDHNFTHFVCQCSRLNTHFAVMADVELDGTGRAGAMADESALVSSFMLFGTLLALASLCLTLLLQFLLTTRTKGAQMKCFFFGAGDDGQQRQPRARLHIYLLLALLQALFLLRLLGPHQQVSLCTAIALLRDFVALAIFFWTFLDVFQLYRSSTCFHSSGTIVYESGKSSSRKCPPAVLANIGTFLFGYGLPMVIVSVVLLLSSHQPNSQQQQNCWPSVDVHNLMFTFTGPVSLLLFGAICLLAFSFWRLRPSSSKCATGANGGSKKNLPPANNSAVRYHPCSTNSTMASSHEDNDAATTTTADFVWHQREQRRLLTGLRRRLKWTAARLALLAAGTSAALCAALSSDAINGDWMQTATTSSIGFFVTAALLALSANTALGLLALAEVGLSKQTRIAYWRWRTNANFLTGLLALLLRPVDWLCCLPTTSQRSKKKVPADDGTGEFAKAKCAAGHSPLANGGGGNFTPNSSSTSSGCSAGHPPGTSACSSELSNTAEVQLSSSGASNTSVDRHRPLSSALQPPAPLLQLYQEHKQRENSNRGSSLYQQQCQPMDSARISNFYGGNQQQMQQNREDSDNNGVDGGGIYEYATIPNDNLFWRQHHQQHNQPSYPSMYHHQRRDNAGHWLMNGDGGGTTSSLGQRPIPTPRLGGPSPLFDGTMPVHPTALYSPRLLHNCSPAFGHYGYGYGGGPGPVVGPCPVRLGMVGQQQVAHADIMPPIMEMGLHSAPPNFPPPPPPAPTADLMLPPFALAAEPVHFRRSSSGSLRSAGGGTPRVVLRMDFSRQQPLFSERIEDNEEEDDALDEANHLEEMEEMARQQQRQQIGGGTRFG